MDLVILLIGFACGFICREVILMEQARRARAHMQKHMVELHTTIEDIRKQIKEEIENELR